MIFISFVDWLNKISNLHIEMRLLLNPADGILTNFMAQIISWFILRMMDV